MANWQFLFLIVAPGCRSTDIVIETGGVDSEGVDSGDFASDVYVTGALPTSDLTKDPLARHDWSKWYRPVDNPVFTTEYGNNHDAVFFYDPTRSYPYYLIVSHETSGTYLWKSKEFSWSSAEWELANDDYDISGHYEYDDGLSLDGTYYLYEDGKVYTHDDSLDSGDGVWVESGSFPKDQADDIGVWYEDGVFHIFGEYGYFPHGPDGTSLSHLTSSTGLGDWTMVDTKAVDPNPDGGDTYGVGDATIAKINGVYYLFCDREEQGLPYRITAWKSESLFEPFEYIDIAIAPRADQVDDWDNGRVQDADIEFIPELNRFVIFANMLDWDGNPGGDFPTLPTDVSRVVGVFYSEDTLP